MAKRQNSVYSGIALDIEQKIENGAYEKGTLLPPERVLQQTYNVQRTTIRRALEILNQKGLIIKKAGLGNLVSNGEKTSVKAVSEKETTNSREKIKKGQLIIAIGTFTESKCTFLPVTKAFESQCRNKGYVFSAVSTNDTQTLEKILKSNVCFGAVCFDELSLEMESILKKYSTHYIYAFSTGKNSRSVVPYVEQALYTFLTDLAEKGHKKIAYIGNESVFSKYVEESLSKAVLSSRINLEASLIYSGETSAQKGYDKFTELCRRMSGLFSAIITPDTQTATGVIKSARDKGMEVPKKLSVASFAYEKNDEITCAVFEKNAFAQEILFCLENEVKSTNKSTIVTSVGFEIYGNSTDNANTGRRNTMSDFLL